MPESLPQTGTALSNRGTVSEAGIPVIVCPLVTVAAVAGVAFGEGLYTTEGYYYRGAVGEFRDG